jgi:hypothetical protein
MLEEYDYNNDASPRLSIALAQSVKIRDYQVSSHAVHAKQQPRCTFKAAAALYMQSSSSAVHAKHAHTHHSLHSLAYTLNQSLIHSLTPTHSHFFTQSINQSIN